MLRDTVATFLESEQWPLRSTDEGLLRTDCAVGELTWPCFVDVVEEDAQVRFYGVVPVLVPFGRRAAMMEALTRANFSLPLGCFELDLEDGEARYRTDLDVEGLDEAVLSAALPVLLRTLVYSNVAVMERYLPALLAVGHGDAEPEAAIRQAEAAEPGSVG